MSLIKNWLSALWPLSVSREVVWEFFTLEVIVGYWDASLSWVFELGSEEGLELSSGPVGELVVVVDLERSSFSQEFGEFGTSNSLVRSDEVSEDGSDSSASLFVLTSIEVGCAFSDLIPSFLSVDDKASSNVVDDGSWVLELGDGINQLLELIVCAAAVLNGIWDGRESLSEESDTFKDSLGLKTDEVFNSFGNLGTNVSCVVEAWS